MQTLKVLGMQTLKVLGLIVAILCTFSSCKNLPNETAIPFNSVNKKQSKKKIVEIMAGISAFDLGGTSMYLP